MELLGNASTIEHLKAALVDKSLPQALLFVGPDAVGKRSLAVEMARLAIGYASPYNLPNLLEVKPEGKSRTIRIGQIRGDDLVEGGVKVWAQNRAPWLRFIVIDEAHTMNETSANYLLKTLEEPPPGCIFILCSSRPQEIPATIRSRTQQVRFQPLTDEEIAPACPEQSSLAKWLELSEGTFKYADLAAFQKVRDLIDAWVLSLTQNHIDLRLVPKVGTLGMAEQLRESLEAGLKVSHSLMRIRVGAQPVLKSWKGPLDRLEQDPLKLAEAILTQMKKLEINPTPGLLLRQLVVGPQ
jgi:DNA polymerase-3 subunit delta'